MIFLGLRGLCGINTMSEATMTRKRDQRFLKNTQCHCIYHMKHAMDYTGATIGKLTVLHRAENKHNKNGFPVVCWNCQCECGEKVIRRSSHLKRGSCRCKKCKALEDAKKFGHGEVRQHHWYCIKKVAEKRKIDFGVSIDYVWQLFLAQERRCSLSKLPLIFAKTRKGHQTGETTASLDRIDSTKGYIEGNVQWVHKWINLMKNDFTTKEFAQYCKLVVENTGDNNE